MNRSVDAMELAMWNTGVVFSKIHGLQATSDFLSFEFFVFQLLLFVHSTWSPHNWIIRSQWHFPSILNTTQFVWNCLLLTSSGNSYPNFFKPNFKEVWKSCSKVFFFILTEICFETSIFWLWKFEANLIDSRPKKC